MSDFEEAYLKNKEDYMSIEEVEEGLLFIKQYFKHNFNGTIELKRLKRLELTAENRINKLYDLLEDPAASKDKESELRYHVDQMTHHYSCIKLLKEIAIVNNLNEINDLSFISKRTLREQAEKILKLESPESYELYLNDKLNKKYGATYGSFYG